MSNKIRIPYTDFYNEGMAYYKSGIILQETDSRIMDEDALFSPIVFLFRHSIELILKSLILHSLFTLKEKDWISIKLPPRNRKLFSIHSIKDLYETWLALDKCVDASGISEVLDDINLIIEKLDNCDFSSTFFRYPYDKNGNRNCRSLTEEIDDQILNSISCHLGAIVNHYGSENFSCLHREQELDCIEYDLDFLIKKLSEYYITQEKSQIVK